MTEPLFKTEGSVWRTGRMAEMEPDEEDEDWVDRSLPSSPLDRTFQDPFEAGPSKLRSGEPVYPTLPDDDDEDLDIKPNFEDVEDRKGSPLREIDADSDGGDVEDERQCRICFSGREEEETLGRLISPCLCIGSVRVSPAYRILRRSTADRAVRPRSVAQPIFIDHSADRQWTVSTPGGAQVQIK
jgi:hypothetical protein